ncbi:hypothetical protein RLOatenuis_8910 [Rickettsiales bacterium]|nr:hypothetical protein RLOatenuis_8910 [Rickettsiales bacterium]
MSRGDKSRGELLKKRGGVKGVRHEFAIKLCPASPTINARGEYLISPLIT